MISIGPERSQIRPTLIGVLSVRGVSRVRSSCCAAVVAAAAAAEREDEGGRQDADRMSGTLVVRRTIVVPLSLRHVSSENGQSRK